MLILIISSGPDKGRVYELVDDAPVILGREGDQVRLDDRKVSRQHAKLWAEGGQWYLKDLDSRHGTYHNSRSLGGSRVKLTDGDRIKIGNTSMTLARMDAEHVERAQLLGEPSTAREAHRAIVPGNRAARVGGIAIAAGIAAVVGLNVYSLVQSNSHTRELRDQITAAEQARDKADLEPMLRDILAAVEGQPDRDAILTAMRTALADQPDQQKTLDKILAKVDAQSSQWLAVADLRDAVGRQQAATNETRDTVAQVLTKLNEAPQAADTTELRTQLAMVLEKLDQQKAPVADEQTLAKLDAVLAKLDKQAAPAVGVDPAINVALAQVLAKLDEQSATSVAVDPAINETLAQVLTKLDQQPTVDTSKTDAKLDAVLAKLDEQSDPAVDPAIRDALSQVLARLDAAPAPAIDAEALAQQVAKHMETVSDADRQTLERIAMEIGAQRDSAAVLAKQSQAQQATIDSLRTEVQQLAEAQRTTPEAIIAEIRGAMAARTDADARLAELVELAASQPRDAGKTDDLLRQVLVELRSQSSSTNEDEVLVGVLRELRGKAIASMDELRQTIRTELDARLIATDGAAPVSDTALAKASPAQPSPTIISPTNPDPRVSMTSALLGTQEIPGDATTNGLSRTEQAYKLAFETGQPITIGAGQKNPMTGIVSEGRTLDPSAAKAAGIKNWRQWYEMDDFAERMRLQQQAMRYREGNPQNPDRVTLPEPTTGRAMP